MRRALSACLKMPKASWGGPQFEARKNRAWEHHLALTAAALWFALLTKLESERECRRDVRIALEMGVWVLPALSTANLRELMWAALPLAPPTLAEGVLSVVERLVRRARSIRQPITGTNGTNRLIQM